jgi:hypothetical protein
MCLLADEELQGIVPKKLAQEQIDEDEVGYYIDERGYRRWGVIKKVTTPEIGFNNNFESYDDLGRIRSSDPRRYNGYL